MATRTLRITVDATGVDEEAKRIFGMVRAPAMRAAMPVAARVAQQALTLYYRNKGRNLWINPTLRTHGPGRELSGWWRLIAEGWFVQSTNARGATLANAATGFAHKVEGGTIKAKRKKYLTIPVIPEAHNKRARDYQAETGKKLFVKSKLGKLFLAERTDNRLRIVYILARQVTQDPWPNALPLPKLYLDPFVNQLTKELIEFGS